jgi:hypothetical protein
LLIPFFPIKLKDRLRESFFRRAEPLIPGISSKYLNRFGGDRNCMARDEAGLLSYAESLCGRLGLGFGEKQAITRLMGGEQLSLL